MSAALLFFLSLLSGWMSVLDILPTINVALSSVSTDVTSISGEEAAPEKVMSDEVLLKSTSLVEVARVHAAESKIDFTSPEKVVIDSIGLVAPVVAEGRTETGAMDVPADDETAGWWQYGKKPGEFGSAVLAGHYKVDDGSPGVFYRLKEVRLGEEIRVQDEEGKVRRFEVEDIVVYPLGEFPLELVFGRKDDEWLNLITCEGAFNPATLDYSHRRVVFARLVE